MFYAFKTVSVFYSKPSQLILFVWLMFYTYIHDSYNIIRTFLLKSNNTEFIHVPLMMLLILHYSIHTVIRPQYWGSSIHSVIIVGHWYVTSLYLHLVNIYCTCYISI